jgi:UDP-2,4-diacetamido-2,4,6-trideoxy-beta-L-altropyranose hydrolase
MKIAFRTDASNKIGTGHLMRCLALADEMKKQGAEIQFISRNLPSHLFDLFSEKGIAVYPLNTFPKQEPIDDLAHSAWLETSQVDDAEATVKALANHLWDWIVVDHYSLDKRWEMAVRPCCKKIMVIDDLADRQHDCDVLLDQNYYSDMQIRYVDKVSSYCKILLGPRYALLRHEFKDLRDLLKPRTGEVKRVLLFFGGVDAENYTSEAMQAIAELKVSLQVDVVIGSQHPNREQIEKTCIDYGFVCHVQTADMAKLMAKADLAIGAGGSASWERCCLGLPALLIAVAENQINIAKALHSVGACCYLGKKEAINSGSIKYAINKLLEQPEQLRFFSMRAFSLVDGLGVSRVSKMLLS